MKNITLNIIGQRILAEILEENKAAIKMNIIVFEEINDYFKKEKIPNSNNIIVTSFSNFKLVEQLETNFSNPIFYIDTEKREKNIKTKFQRYELIYCPFSLKNFVEKINIIYLKSQFADNSKVQRMIPSRVSLCDPFLNGRAFQTRITFTLPRISRFPLKAI